MKILGLLGIHTKPSPELRSMQIVVYGDTTKEMEVQAGTAAIAAFGPRFRFRIAQDYNLADNGGSRHKGLWVTTMNVREISLWAGHVESP